MYCFHLYPPRRAWSAFISPQSDLASILVVLWIIIFLSKVKLCKSCLPKCNWFVVWLRMTSESFHPLSHLLRNEKAVGRISLFPRSIIINRYCLSRSTMLSYTPIVVQNRGLKVTPSCFSALCKYIEMNSESLSTIRDDWDVKLE